MKNRFIFAALTLTAAAFGAPLQISHLPEAAELIEKTGYRGTVLIYDLDTETLFASDPAIADERFIPASTFKILSSLAALESGLVDDENTVLPWDGITRGRSETNRDLDFATAFRISSVPHYQELVRQIGATQMQAYLDSTPYGNRDISGGIDQFWLSGDLRISPREQIEILERLYQDDLPFSQHAMDTVKAMMFDPTTSTPQYWAKTGWATLPENRNIGWWVGWAKQDERLLFFATVLDSKSPRDDFGDLRKSLTQKTLQLLYTQ